MRVLLLLLAAVPLAAQGGGGDVTSFQAQKAHVMLRTKLPCLGCHELAGEGGRVGPSLDSVGGRRSASYIAAIIDDPQRTVPGSLMPRVLMPPATRDLIVRYLSRSAAVAPTHASASRVLSASSPQGSQRQPSPSQLYGRWCATCHGPKGDGDGPNAKFLPSHPAVHSSADQMSLRSDDALFDAIAGGGAIMGKSPRMPPFGATLTAPEIRALVAYIRSLCGCKGPAWSLGTRR